jgi:hypothetical protein
MNRNVFSISLTPAERRGDGMDPARLDAMVGALRQDGCVILEDAVEPAHVAALRDRLLADLPAVLARPSPPFNFNRGNVQQSPPRHRALLFRDVLLHEQVIALSNRMLLRPHNTLYSGNTALPSLERQPVHCDRGHLWALPDTPAHCLIINLMLVDTSPENGMTELWLGTHRIPAVLDGDTVDVRIPAEHVEARRLVCPPIQPVVRAGSILIRDNRLWHAGMPNHTAQARPMLTLVHTAGWLPTWERTQLQADTQDCFQHPKLTYDADFIAGSIDHTQLDQPYAL